MIGAALLLATIYYVSPTGGDGNVGTSPSSAWRSINKVNATTFQSGDQVLFQGGQSFAGALALDNTSYSGSLTIGSYGTGRARINSATASGLTLKNRGGLTVKNLIFTGGGTSAVDGVSAYNAMAGTGKLNFLRFINLEITGYGKSGLGVYGGYGPNGSGTDTAGFNDVVIDGVLAHHNTNVHKGGSGTAGIIVRGRYGFNVSGQPTHTNVTITRSTSHDNLGATGAPNWTGSGIFLGQTRTGVITHSVAYNNGQHSGPTVGTVGIWAADADKITIQFCASYSNRTQAGEDGGGFDFDGGVTNSVMQYNESQDNDGPGYLFAHYTEPGLIYSFLNNIMRYNVSRNDARRNSAGGIDLWHNGGTGIKGSQIYNNFILVGPASSGSPSAARFRTWTDGTVMARNTFVTSGGRYLLNVVSGQKNLNLSGNSYATSDQNFKILWNGTVYTSLSAWKTASGQEDCGC